VKSLKKKKNLTFQWLCLILYLYKQFLRLGQNLPLSYSLLWEGTCRFIDLSLSLKSVRELNMAELFIVLHPCQSWGGPVCCKSDIPKIFEQFLGFTGMLFYHNRKLIMKMIKADVHKLILYMDFSSWGVIDNELWLICMSQKRVVSKFTQNIIYGLLLNFPLYG
jgi:hypothetical protein